MRKKSRTAYIATDSEWDKRRHEPWLSTAFTGPDGTVVYLTQDVPEAVKERLGRAAGELGVEIIFLHRDDDANLLADALGRLGVEEEEIRLLHFFSPKDVEFAVGWSPFQEAIHRKNVRQKNNLSGLVEIPGRKVRIKDLSGWAGKVGLAKFAASLGFSFEAKTVMDQYKTRMYDGLVEQPEDFLRYAVADTTVLPELHGAFLSLFRDLQRECLDMDGADLWTPEETPMTVGSLVATTIERWLHRQAPDRDVFKFCVRKLGLLDVDDKKYQFSLRSFLRCREQYRTVGSLRTALAGEKRPAELDQFYRAKYLHTGLDACSVRWWAGRPVVDSSGYNALVPGGRCQNEDPYHYSIDRGADIDIAGCYGEALRSLSYPVGLPTVWSTTSNQGRTTFGAWLDRTEKDLVPGLWMATVSGKLSFDQDLIQSKLVRRVDIQKAVAHQVESEETDIPSDFELLRREIRNGVITSDVLHALRSVVTTTEWAGIRSLELVTAVAYLAHDRRESLADWCAAVLADRGEYRSWRGEIRDSRTRAWAAVPLEGFVGRMYERRMKYKKLKQAAATEDERLRAAGMDSLLKLCVNTVYGCLASRFFCIGNTVLGNNITARARVGVWMLAKALGLRQTITDGGFYDPAAVCHFSGKNPGLDSLSRQWEWHAPNRRRWHRPMGKWDWQQEVWPDLSDLDRMALAHVRDFWFPYGLDFPFRLEHKATFQRGAYWSKGDYALLLEDGEVQVKLRGKDKRAKPGEEHPTFTVLRNILEVRDDFPDDLRYVHRSIMRVGKYRVVQASNGFDHLKNHRPGDDYFEPRIARYNNTYFPLGHEQDYLHRKQRKRVNRGKTVQYFEKYGREGIASVHRHMAQDRLHEGKRSPVLV